MKVKHLKEILHNINDEVDIKMVDTYGNNPAPFTVANSPNGLVFQSLKKVFV